MLAVGLYLAEETQHTHTHTRGAHMHAHIHIPNSEQARGMDFKLASTLPLRLKTDCNDKIEKDQQ